MYTSSVIEISEKAYKANVDFIRTMLGPHCNLSAVVKGNAYGHNIETIVPLAIKHRVSHFSVFSADEALRVHNVAAQKARIMIMGLVNKEQMEWVVKNNIEFFVFDLERLHLALKISKKTKIAAKVHLEVETGMNRLGLNSTDFHKAIELIQKNNQHLIFTGLCTHFAGAESIANYSRVKKQLSNYNRLYKGCIKRNFTPQVRHTACSAASLSYPTSRMDMARIGIMQYGLWSSKETFIGYLSKQIEKEDPLQRVLTWKSKVMNIQQVKQGEFVGYGTTFLAEYDMLVATVPVGYSDGFSRTLSNQGRVLIHGNRISVIGIVNMNMMLVDVTNIPQTKQGDEVVIIGQQGDLSISVSSFGELSSQLNYELLTRISTNIPRKVVA